MHPPLQTHILHGIHIPAAFKNDYDQNPCFSEWMVSNVIIFIFFLQ